LSNIGSGNAMIPVTCDPKGRLDRVSLDEIEEFQGGLKSLSETEYGKLKQSIAEKGFIVPCFAWRNGSSKWKLLDGHQRVRVIRKEGRQVEKRAGFLLAAA
jgi:ParB-like chromosome segregation protein Spo0J